jgi:pimeloyl-ACP methyl ester carboxylesterase
MTNEEAPPVALVHGWGGSPNQAWPGTEGGVTARLHEAGRTTITPALPGHSPIPGTANPEAYSDLERQFQRTLPSGPLDGVGFSLGGKVLLRLAAQPRSRFRRLVIIGVGANVFVGESGSAAAATLESGVTASTPPALGAVVNAAIESGNDPSTMAAVIQRPSAPMNADELASIDCPVLLIAGADDLIGTDAEALASSLQNSQMVKLPGRDHLALLSAPELPDLITDFLTDRP